MAAYQSKADRPIPHVQVIGSLNIDLVTTTSRVPDGGETLTATSFATHPGGKGANQAVACARASRNRPSGISQGGGGDNDESVRVSMVGAVGNDAYADLLSGALREDGVQCDAVRKIDSTTTGVAVILVEETTGENRILITPGANGRMLRDCVPPFSGESRPDLIVMQLEIPVETVLYILGEAKREGIEVVLNPAPAIKLPDQALDGLSHLVLNETEAGILCDLEPPPTSEKMSEFLDSAFAVLAGKGAKSIVITLGGEGVAFCTPVVGQKASWHKIDAHRVSKVVDTTAAGDTFVGYYAVGLLEAKRISGSSGSWDPAPIIGRANRAAARTVTRQGAMESIPFKDES